MRSTSNYGITSTGRELFPTTSSNIWQELAKSKQFREEFNALQLKRGVPFQIRALLNERGWTQEKLAESAKLTQGVVSRAQNPDYGNLTIKTITRIAAGFDVAFVGAFVPFSRLVEWFENLSEESGKIKSFEDEYNALLIARTSRSRFRRRTVRRRMKLIVSSGENRKITQVPAGEQRQRFEIVSEISGRTAHQLHLPLPPSVGEVTDLQFLQKKQTRTGMTVGPWKLKTAVGGITHGY